MHSWTNCYLNPRHNSVLQWHSFHVSTWHNKCLICTWVNCRISLHYISLDCFVVNYQEDFTVLCFQLFKIFLGMENIYYVIVLIKQIGKSVSYKDLIHRECIVFTIIVAIYVIINIINILRTSKQWYFSQEHILFVRCFKIYDNTDFWKSLRWWPDLLAIYKTRTAESFNLPKACVNISPLFWKSKHSNNRNTECGHNNGKQSDLKLDIFQIHRWDALNLLEYTISDEDNRTSFIWK